MRTCVFGFKAARNAARFGLALAALAAFTCAARPGAAQAKEDDDFGFSKTGYSDGGPADDESSPARVPKIKGLIKLFSGSQKDLETNWMTTGSKGKPKWLVENGHMTTVADSIITKQNFLDFQLHVEFKVPYMPNEHGQGRGNSGVGLLGVYEIQVLDSYGIREPGSGDCGAVYSQSAPLINACKAPRQWQTYDIFFHGPTFENGVKTKNARVTVFQNGICVQNNQEILRATGIASKEIEGPGPIYLQYHNNTVQFRNVWIVPLPREGQTHYEPR
jgi:Domain of Unknown Function (DUF1080)